MNLLRWRPLVAAGIVDAVADRVADSLAPKCRRTFSSGSLQ